MVRANKTLVNCFSILVGTGFILFKVCRIKNNYLSKYIEIPIFYSCLGIYL